MAGADDRFDEDPGVTLVRPDGYVAYGAPGRDPSSDTASLRAALDVVREMIEMTPEAG